jgi:hypothetical protein
MVFLYTNYRHYCFRNHFLLITLQVGATQSELLTASLQMHEVILWRWIYVTDSWIVFPSDPDGGETSRTGPVTALLTLGRYLSGTHFTSFTRSSIPVSSIKLERLAFVSSFIDCSLLLLFAKLSAQILPMLYPPFIRPQWDWPCSGWNIWFLLCELLKDASTFLLYSVRKVGWWIGKDLEGSKRNISYNLSGRAEVNHEQRWLPISPLS